MIFVAVCPKRVTQAPDKSGSWELICTWGALQKHLTVNPLSVNGNPYEGILPDEDYVYFQNIPVERFRVLKLGPQDPEIEPEVVDVGCAEFEE